MHLLILSSYAPNSDCAVVLPVTPNQVHPRLMVQQGNFTIHGRREDGTGIALSPDPDYLWKIRIPREAKKELLVALRLWGCHTAALYPDLDHLAQHLQESIA